MCRANQQGVHRQQSFARQRLVQLLEPALQLVDRIFGFRAGISTVKYIKQNGVVVAEAAAKTLCFGGNPHVARLG